MGTAKQGPKTDGRTCQHCHHKRMLPGVCTLTVKVRKDLGIETISEKWYIFSPRRLQGGKHTGFQAQI